MYLSSYVAVYELWITKLELRRLFQHYFQVFTKAFASIIVTPPALFFSALVVGDMSSNVNPSQVAKLNQQMAIG